MLARMPALALVAILVVPATGALRDQGTPPPPAPGPVRAQRIGVDPRVELFSIVFRLAGSPEYSQCQVPAYAEAIDAYFEPYRGHEAVQLARRARETAGVGFDAVMHLAVRVKDVSSLEELIPLDTDRTLDARWKRANPRPLLAALRRFVADTRFAAFLASQKPLYDLTDARAREQIDKEGDLAWYAHYFGEAAPGRFTVVPGPTNGGPSYGSSVIGPDGVRDIYAIPGVWELDAAMQPRFSRRWMDVVVHEFVHSFTNPLIDRFEKDLQPAGPAIIAPVREAMARQAYSQWQTVLRESLVRASTIRYIASHAGADAARTAIRDERNRSFFWVGDLAILLEQYENSRSRYPTLASFMPRVVEFFTGLAPRVPDLARQYDAARPKVVSTSIADGSADVDPKTTEVVIRFDRAMTKTTYAVMRPPKAEMAPSAGLPRFDAAGTVVTIPVALMPAHEYLLLLNGPVGGGFMSEDGVPLAPVRISFKTRSPSEQP